MELLEASIEVTSQLADATNNRQRSLLPTDLETVNTVLGQVLGVLEDSADMMAAIDAQPDEVNLCMSQQVLHWKTLAYHGLKIWFS